MKITHALKTQLKASLKEDIGKGDVTSRLLISPKAQGRAVIVAKESGVFCGEAVTREIFRLVNARTQIHFFVKDGQAFAAMKKIAEIKGPVISLLEAERTALNLLGHLCGIATRTRAFVNKAKKYKVRILDTRKTTPLWRDLEKAAVKTGGGQNHRMGLYDAIFVKENHRKFGDLRKLFPSPYPSPRRGEGRERGFEIEVRNVREMMEALMIHPKVILFDNFSPKDLKEAVKIARRCNPKILLEASGGMNLENVEAYAKTGVDRISIGSLTHSVKAIDLSLLIQ